MKSISRLVFMTSSLTSWSRINYLGHYRVQIHNTGHHYVQRSPNSDKTSRRRSILKVITSSLWRHRVTWRHR